MALGSVVSLVKECHGLPGCPNHRALSCLELRCGDCCKILGMCRPHKDLQLRKEALERSLR